MLTIKKPMELKTNQKALTMNQGFSQRLLHGYSLMTATIAPKDLLFLLTAPMGFPEEFGNNTSLNLQNNFTDVRQVTIDVVNNIVNRIMLEQYTPFTYQDQVYLTTALQKLGVTDVNYFINEVRQLRKEQNNTAHLQRLYEKTLSHKAVAKVIFQGTEKHQTQETSEESATWVTPSPRYYLHETIFQRLETGDVYQEVLQFQSNQLTSHNYIENKALLLAEQLRLTHNMAIQQSKNQLFQRNEMTLHHYKNHFETGDVLKVPETEEEVLGQAAQAAIYATIQQVMIHTIGEGRLEKESWIPLDHNVARLAENTLNRFEYYHSETQLSVDNGEYQSLYEELQVEELDYLLQFSKNVAEYQEISQKYQSHSVVTEISSPTLEHLHSQEGDVLTEETHLSEENAVETVDIAQITQQILQKNIFQPSDSIGKTKEKLVKTDFVPLLQKRELEVERSSINHWNMLHQLQGFERELLTLQQEGTPVSQEVVQESLTQVQSVVESVTAPLERTLLESRETLEHHSTEQRVTQESLVHLGRDRETEGEEVLPTEKQGETSETVVEKSSTSEIIGTLTKEHQVKIEEKERFSALKLQHEISTRELTSEERVEENKRIVENNSTIQESKPAIAKAVELLRETRRQIEQRVEQTSEWMVGNHTEFYDQSRYENNVQELELTFPQSVTSPKEDMVALEKQLNLLDLEHRAKLQEIQEISTHVEVETMLPRPVDNKRTMENALRALTSPETVFQELNESQLHTPVKLELPAHVEQILAKADPATRAIYESILMQEQNLEGGHSPLVKPASLSGLMGDLQAINQKQPVSMAHLPKVNTESPFQEEEGSHRQMMTETLEDFPRKKVSTPSKPKSGWDKTSIVFKKEGNTMTEELTEWLETQQKQTVQKETVEQVKVEQTTNQVVYQENTKQVVTQNTQDISELVNRTLAKQMGTIADQVYQQMERKLQKERSRRGRL